MSPSSDRDRSGTSTQCTRRTVLATLAASSVGALAGCNESGSDGTAGPTTGGTSPTSGVTTTGTATPPPSGTDRSTEPPTGATTAPETPALPDGEWELPSYVDRSAFREFDLEIDRPGCPLPARLSLPRVAGERPFAVIVHGSGPQDMDGTTGAVRPYRDLAWGLASHGVAALRYDKVTAACPGALSTATLDTVVVDDATRAVERLRRWAGTPERPSITELTVVGHSLGGGALPRVVDRADGVDRGVALAGNARPLYVALVDQIRQLQRADGDLSESENETYDRLQTGVDRIDAGEYGAAAEVFRPYGLTAAFLRSLAEYDRFATARGTDVPLTFAQGSADVRVTVADDFERWQSELADRPDTRFQVYEGLNHLFTPSPGGLGRTAYSTPSNVARPVIEDLAGWLGGSADGASR